MGVPGVMTTAGGVAGVDDPPRVARTPPIAAPAATTTIRAMTLPEMALRFILANPDVSTIIPGMRELKNVEANIAASDAGGLQKASAVDRSFRFHDGRIGALGSVGSDEPRPADLARAAGATA